MPLPRITPATLTRIAAPKLEDQRVLDTLLASHPDFEGATNWDPGPNPPDFIGTRANGEKIGLELTEWLDGERTTKSITRTDAEYRWLEALRTENEPAPKSFDRVTLGFKESVQFNETHVPRFREEFLAIATGRFRGLLAVTFCGRSLSRYLEEHSLSLRRTGKNRIS